MVFQNTEFRKIKKKQFQDKKTVPRQITVPNCNWNWKTVPGSNWNCFSVTVSVSSRNWNCFSVTGSVPTWNWNWNTVTVYVPTWNWNRKTVPKQLRQLRNWFSVTVTILHDFKPCSRRYQPCDGNAVFYNRYSFWISRNMEKLVGWLDGVKHNQMVFFQIL